MEQNAVFASRSRIVDLDVSYRKCSIYAQFWDLNSSINFLISGEDFGM